MRCTRPFVKQNVEFGCGQCMPCRINKRREWTARLMLEAQCHEKMCFLTLTYDDKNLPQNGSLSKDHYQKWLKRLRKAIYPQKVRYFIAGEYGDQTWRPHWHVALFGFSAPYRGLVIRNGLPWLTQEEKTLTDTWPFGQIHVGKLNEQSLSYCCKHLTKGLPKHEALSRGLVPEFFRQSRKPAIGVEALSAFIQFATSDKGSRAIAQSGQIPSTIRFGNRQYSIGRTLTNFLSAEIGLDQRTRTNETIRQMSLRTLERWESLGESGIKSDRLNQAKKAAIVHSRRKTKL